MNKKQIEILEEMRNNCKEQLKAENSQKGMQYYLALNRAVYELKLNRINTIKVICLGLNAGLLFALILIIVLG